MPSVTTIRRMDRGDLPAARRLQHDEHWNQTPEDWELFLRANPDGCFVAVGSDSGVPDDGALIDTESHVSPVGTITSIRYDTSACWISMLLVDHKWRGHGIGTRLMEHTIAANEQVCGCLRLDATPAGKPVYERLGFRIDYEVQRWMAESVVTPHAIPSTCTRLDPQSLPAVLPFDREVFGADRSMVLAHLLRELPESAWEMHGDGQAPSYVLGRRGEHCHHIGPIVAQEESDAADLLVVAISELGNHPVAIDVVAPSEAFAERLTRLGFVFQRPFTRMSRGSVVAERQDVVVAIVGPEFG
jgi:GNAT superfamily N-acetyltransferase